MDCLKAYRVGDIHEGNSRGSGQLLNPSTERGDKAREQEILGGKKSIQVKFWDEVGS